MQGLPSISWLYLTFFVVVLFDDWETILNIIDWLLIDRYYWLFWLIIFLFFLWIPGLGLWEVAILMFVLVNITEDTEGAKRHKKTPVWINPCRVHEVSLSKRTLKFFVNMDQKNTYLNTDWRKKARSHRDAACISLWNN